MIKRTFNPENGLKDALKRFRNFFPENVC